MEVIESGNVTYAFLLTLFAGLATGIGSALAFFTKRTDKRVLSVALGFSAGVMIYVSLIELFPEARRSLGAEYGEITGYWITVAAFFLGIGLSALIDSLVPSYENPHELKEPGDTVTDLESLKRMGMFSAIAIAIHNFPEGIATFTAALGDPKIGISIAIAVAIHNIPEGIAVSVPVFFATGDRKKAFWWSFLSGLTEPLGALVGFLVLRPFLSEGVMGMTFALVAGIMVFISLDELLPAAEKWGKHHHSIYGLIAGMAVMALSLLLFA
jgi:zinc transporter, ZIP family